MINIPFTKLINDTEIFNGSQGFYYTWTNKDFLPNQQSSDPLIVQFAKTYEGTNWRDNTVYARSTKLENSKYYKIEVDYNPSLKSNRNANHLILFLIHSGTYYPFAISKGNFPHDNLSDSAGVLSFYFTANEKIQCNEVNTLNVNLAKASDFTVGSRESIANGVDLYFTQLRRFVGTGLPSTKNGSYVEGHGKISQLRSDVALKSPQFTVDASSIQLTDDYKTAGSSDIGLSSKGAVNFYEYTKSELDKRLYKDQPDILWTKSFKGTTLLRELHSYMTPDEFKTVIPPISLTDFWLRLRTFMSGMLKSYDHIAIVKGSKLKEVLHGIKNDILAYDKTTSTSLPGGVIIGPTSFNIPYKISTKSIVGYHLTYAGESNKTTEFSTVYYEVALPNGKVRAAILNCIYEVSGTGHQDGQFYYTFLFNVTKLQDFDKVQDIPLDFRNESGLIYNETLMNLIPDESNALRLLIHFYLGSELEFIPASISNLNPVTKLLLTGGKTKKDIKLGVKILVNTMDGKRELNLDSNEIYIGRFGASYLNDSGQGDPNGNYIQLLNELDFSFNIKSNIDLDNVSLLFRRTKLYDGGIHKLEDDVLSRVDIRSGIENEVRSIFHPLKSRYETGIRYRDSFNPLKLNDFNQLAGKQYLEIMITSNGVPLYHKIMSFYIYPFRADSQSVHLTFKSVQALHNYITGFNVNSSMYMTPESIKIADLDLGDEDRVTMESGFNGQELRFGTGPLNKDVLIKSSSIKSPSGQVREEDIDIHLKGDSTDSHYPTKLTIDHRNLSDYFSGNSIEYGYSGELKWTGVSEVKYSSDGFRLGHKLLSSTSGPVNFGELISMGVRSNIRDQIYRDISDGYAGLHTVLYAEVEILTNNLTVSKLQNFGGKYCVNIRNEEFRNGLIRIGPDTININSYYSGDNVITTKNPDVISSMGGQVWNIGIYSFNRNILDLHHVNPYYTMDSIPTDTNPVNLNTYYLIKSETHGRDSKLRVKLHMGSGYSTEWITINLTELRSL